MTKAKKTTTTKAAKAKPATVATTPAKPVHKIAAMVARLGSTSGVNSAAISDDANALRGMENVDEALTWIIEHSEGPTVRIHVSIDLQERIADMEPGIYVAEHDIQMAHWIDHGTSAASVLHLAGKLSAPVAASVVFALQTQEQERRAAMKAAASTKAAATRAAAKASQPASAPQTPASEPAPAKPAKPARATTHAPKSQPATPQAPASQPASDPIATMQASIVARLKEQPRFADSEPGLATFLAKGKGAGDILTKALKAMEADGLVKFFPRAKLWALPETPIKAAN